MSMDQTWFTSLFAMTPTLRTCKGRGSLYNLLGPPGRCAVAEGMVGCDVVRGGVGDNQVDGHALTAKYGDGGCIRSSRYLHGLLDSLFLISHSQCSMFRLDL